MADECCAPSGESPHEADVAEPQAFWRLRSVQLSAASGILLAGGLLTSMIGADRASLGLFLVGAAVGGSTFVPESVASLARGRVGVGTLMSIAAAGAIILGELGEAASLAFLFSISEALEGYAMARTRRGLRALLSLVPERVLVRRDTGQVELDPAELREGDMMVVRPGERLATDGVVRRGRSTLDISAITGESVPVEVDLGSSVYAASINGGGVLDVEVTARTTESSLARVVHIVEEAQERKGGSQRLAERIARPLVPGIMVIAAAVAVVGSLAGDPQVWIARSLVVLVAAAPCAFAISVPVTVVAAVGAAARMGALVKGGAALEALSGTRFVAFDKTGTLTRNEPSVVSVVPAEGLDAEDVLSTAAALEAHSEHPLAAAILGAASKTPPASDVTAVTGSGVAGLVEGRPARLGKPGFVPVGDLDRTVEAFEREGCTVVAVERGDLLLGVIAVRDELRPEARAVVHRLRGLGVERVAMLTGDNRRTANALAAGAGLDEVHAELLPEGKVRVVEQLRARGDTAMIGDGINDAPALATADVGLAMGAMGSDVAIETADVALMGERLTHLPEVLHHARRAGRIMRQNLVLSGLIIGTLIPVAAFGVLGLAAVVAVHEVAEVAVIANGVRAGRINHRISPSARSDGSDADELRGRDRSEVPLRGYD